MPERIENSNKCWKNNNLALRNLAKNWVPCPEIDPNFIIYLSQKKLSPNLNPKFNSYLFSQTNLVRHKP